MLGFLAMAAVLALTGCKTPQKGEKGGEEGEGEDSAVLAKVGDVEITVSDFQDTINAYSPYLRQKYNSPEMRKKKLEEMVEFELLALEARNLGYADEATVQEALKQQLVRELQEEILSDIKLEDITEEEAKAYYDAHPEKYHKPPQRRLAHIVMSDQAKAQALLDELMKDETNAVLWRESVMNYSESSDSHSKHHGGDLGYVSKLEDTTDTEPAVDDALVEAAWAIEDVGHLHPELVEVSGQWHIIKLTSTRPAIDRTFDQVRRQIQSILWKEKREQAQQDFIEKLEKENQVEVNYELLDEIEIPGPKVPDPAQAHAPVTPAKTE